MIFARSARADASQKHLKNGLAVFEALNAQTVQTVRSTGLPYFISSEKDQVGAGFGDRFTHAIQEVYDLGFENVITVGNDSPHLRAKHILQTVAYLEDKPLVLGPSQDGGFYLMGLHRSQFNATTFLKLPWQTANLMQSIVRLLNAKKIKCAFLETLVDLDVVADVHEILRSSKTLNYQIRELLADAIAFFVPVSEYNIPSFDFPFEASAFNKGSPVLVNC
ncbi:MAG: DUF2064 domain-containing protein [Leeuwenhoekiella sp.]